MRADEIELARIHIAPGEAHVDHVQVATDGGVYAIVVDRHGRYRLAGEERTLSWWRRILYRIVWA